MRAAGASQHCGMEKTTYEGIQKPKRGISPSYKDGNLVSDDGKPRVIMRVPWNTWRRTYQAREYAGG